MTWGKVSDHLDDDARFIGISDGAAGLFFMTLPRCLRRREPFIPSSVVESRHSEPADVEALLARALWIPAVDGYAIDELLWSEISLPSDHPTSSAQHAAAGRASAEARRERYGTAKPGVTEQTDQSPNGVHEHVPNGVPRTSEQRSPNGRTPTPEPVPVNASLPYGRLSAQRSQLGPSRFTRTARALRSATERSSVPTSTRAPSSGSRRIADDSRRSARRRSDYSRKGMARTC